MIILIDIGNTNTNWGIAKSIDDIRGLHVSKTTKSKTVLKKEFQKILISGDVEGIVIGSVVPDVCESVKEIAKTICNEQKIFVPYYEEFSELMELKIKPDVIKPGADRLANALALKKLYSLPACAIDVGTAITLEVVDKQGKFLGGAIAPGEELQLKALQEYTSQLGAIKKLPKSVPGIGNNTANAMAVGIKRGVPWAVIGMLSGVEEYLGQPLESIVVTGGNAIPMCMFLEKIYQNVESDELLTLRGLACAWYARRASQRVISDKN